MNEDFNPQALDLRLDVPPALAGLSRDSLPRQQRDDTYGGNLHPQEQPCGHRRDRSPARSETRASVGGMAKELNHNQHRGGKMRSTASWTTPPAAAIVTTAAHALPIANSPWKEAVSYAKRKWRVVPLYHPLPDGSRSC